MLFGAHVSAAGGISKAIDRIQELRGNAVQVFTQSPRMWRPTQHAPEELERFRVRRRQARVKHVSCHALYLVNLASRDRAIRKASFTALCATMETARGIGADAVVLHVGSHLGYGFREAVKKVTPALRGLLELTTDEVERAKLREQIRDKVRSVTGMNCVVELVPPRTLPRTGRATST